MDRRTAYDSCIFIKSIRNVNESPTQILSSLNSVRVTEHRIQKLYKIYIELPAKLLKADSSSSLSLTLIEKMMNEDVLISRLILVLAFQFIGILFKNQNWRFKFCNFQKFGM